MKLINKYKLKT